jgi:hypothetical protein
MASSPGEGVVDRDCRAFDHLYVCDGSIMPELSEKNPTLTIMALPIASPRHWPPQAVSREDQRVVARSRARPRSAATVRRRTACSSCRATVLRSEASS